MRRGWLAFLVSLTIHGGLAAALCLMPGSRVDKASASFIEEARGAEPAIMTFLVAERTDVVEIHTAPLAVAPPKPPAIKPAAATTPRREPIQPSTAIVSKSLSNNAAEGGSGETASAGSGAGSGMPTTFFQVPASGRKIIYLIDGSASMGLHGELEAACREVLRSVRCLPARVQFQVIVYNRAANPLLPASPHWLSPTPETLRSIEEALSHLEAEGGTDHAKALERAIYEQPDVIFFLTDAGEVRPDLPRLAAQRNRGRASIHVIEMNADSARGNNLPLQALAHQNRGMFQAVVLSATAP